MPWVHLANGLLVSLDAISITQLSFLEWMDHTQNSEYDIGIST
jgi:hypothetical protein